jgi:hypothetical protein
MHFSACIQHGMIGVPVKTITGKIDYFRRMSVLEDNERWMMEMLHDSKSWRMTIAEDNDDYRR